MWWGLISVVSEPVTCRPFKSRSTDDPYANDAEDFLPALHMARAAGLRVCVDVPAVASEVLQLAIHLAEVSDRTRDDAVLLAVKPDRIGVSSACPTADELTSTGHGTFLDHTQPASYHNAPLEVVV